MTCPVVPVAVRSVKQRRTRRFVQPFTEGPQVAERETDTDQVAP